LGGAPRRPPGGCERQPAWCPELRQRRRARRAPLPSPPPQLTFDGRFLTTTDGNTIRFWDVASLSEVKSHTVTYPVEAASYCPAKGRFACGGGDMWVRLHAFEDGAELECNRGHHGPVHTVRFGPEGKEYASVRPLWRALGGGACTRDAAEGMPKAAHRMLRPGAAVQGRRQPSGGPRPRTPPNHLRPRCRRALPACTPQGSEDGTIRIWATDYTST
jgi:hypothetical protein